MTHEPIAFERGVFCTRTLNLQSIQAIGYDMDYTLVHYNVEAWEGKAYEHVKQRLDQEGWPVADLEFNPLWAIRGLIIDKQRGNILKVNRFGYIKQAAHGMRMFDPSTLRKIYRRTIVDLADSRYAFMNTLFDISEACIYSQLVDLFDARILPEIRSYVELYDKVRATLNRAHVEGKLKEEIMADPERYVELDPDQPQTLLDQKHAGKKLMLITNSGWKYTRFMMSYAFDRFLPAGMTWRDLFHIIIVSARKPDFFSGNAPIFRVVNEEGLLEQVVESPREMGIYLAGNAAMLEQFLGVSGDEILYVGDHIFYDVNVSKNILRWRTALIVRELERELQAVEKARQETLQIYALMREKEQLEFTLGHLQLTLQRQRADQKACVEESVEQIPGKIAKISSKIETLDARIYTLMEQGARRFNPIWGYLMRTHNDKSHLMRQTERYADIYTSRVSNLLPYTPFMYFRSPRGSLPHDHVYTGEAPDLPDSVE